MILLCYGTRPEWIKIKPLIDEMTAQSVPHKVLFTGQHVDIGGGEYDIKLSIADGSNRLNAIVSSILNYSKEEIFDGVKDTARKSHPNGYERMLSVMEQAVKISAPNYLLSSSPYWISGKIKKGVCHYLVNDHKLRWVKKKHG